MASVFSYGFSRVMVVGCNFLVPLAMPYTLHDKSQFQNAESISFVGGRFCCTYLRNMKDLESKFSLTKLLQLLLSHEVFGGSAYRSTYNDVSSLLLDFLS